MESRYKISKKLKSVKKYLKYYNGVSIFIEEEKEELCYRENVFEYDSKKEKYMLNKKINKIVNKYKDYYVINIGQYVIWGDISPREIANITISKNPYDEEEILKKLLIVIKETQEKINEIIFPKKKENVFSNSYHMYRFRDNTEDYLEYKKVKDVRQNYSGTSV